MIVDTKFLMVNHFPIKNFREILFLFKVRLLSLSTNKNHSISGSADEVITLLFGVLIKAI